MADMSIEEVRKQVKTYWIIFGSLAILTAVTVGLSYLHLSHAPAIALGLLVAVLKASLVALFFMHLNHEKPIIYGTLFLTAAALFFCMLIPVFLM